MGDLRRGEEVVVNLDLGDEQPSVSSPYIFKSSRVRLRSNGDREDEIILNLDNDPPQVSPPALPPSTAATSAAPPAAPKVNNSKPSATPQADLQFVIEDEDPRRSAAHRIRSSHQTKLKRGSAREEELVLRLDDEQEDQGRPAPVQRIRSSHPPRLRHGGAREEELFLSLDDDKLRTAAEHDRACRNDSALQNHRQHSVPDIILSQNVENTATASTLLDNTAEKTATTSTLPDNTVENTAKETAAEETPVAENTAADNTAGATSEDDYGEEEAVEDDLIIEDEKTGVKTHLASKKGKGIGGKVKDKLFPNRHLPKKKKMNRTKKVEKYVDSIMVEDLDRHGRVTPVFVGEEHLSHEDFAQKRQHLLQRKPKNYQEGAEEVIELGESPPGTCHLSPASAEIAMIEERKRIAFKRKEEKAATMKLEGIREEVPECSLSLSAQPQPQKQQQKKTVLSPEEYEDYIGDTLEKDYPELAGGGILPPQTQEVQQHSECLLQEPVQLAQSQEQQMQEQQLEQQAQELLYQQQLQEQLHQQQLQEQLQQQQLQEQLYQQQLQEQLHYQQLQVHQQQPTGPLSGSASMNFMDDHSPTSNGNGDFFHRCISKYPRDPPRQALGSFSVEAKNLMISELGSRDETCRNLPETNVLNNNESMTSFATHFRTSCVASSIEVSGDRRPKRTTSVSSSNSASANESRNNSTSASEHSSMSISTGSVSSNKSNVNKNRSNLFLPTSTTSLPEISIEPPTTQAPKPKDNFDRENKVKYDLRVPGYRSMFLTVPGFDDDDSDRYLPKYSFDCDNEEQSSSDDDDDVVHKPRVFASLAGVAESRGLKRYGSSCDIAKLGKNSPEEPVYSYDDDYNGNMDSCPRTSKPGGTGSGPFVAGKLAMFERVVEEEHQKLMESQEIRKRKFRAPRKSGEYIEKFYSPQVIENVDARANEHSRSLRYYDDVFDEYDNPRSPTPLGPSTPYGGHSSPQHTSTSRHSSRVYSSSSNDMPKTPPPQVHDYSSFCRSPQNYPPIPSSPPPLVDCPPPHRNYDEYDVDDLVGYRASTPTSSINRTETRQISPVPQQQQRSGGGTRNTSCSSTASASAPGTSRRGKDNLQQQTDEVML